MRKYFYKGDNFCDFLFSLHIKTLQKGINFKRKEFAPRGSVTEISLYPMNYEHIFLQNEQYTKLEFSMNFGLISQRKHKLHPL